MSLMICVENDTLRIEGSKEHNYLSYIPIHIITSLNDTYICTCTFFDISYAWFNGNLTYLK